MAIHPTAAAPFRPVQPTFDKAGQTTIPRAAPDLRSAPLPSAPETATPPAVGDAPAKDSVELSGSKARAHGVVRLLAAGHFKPHVQAHLMAKFGHLVPREDAPDPDEPEADAPILDDLAPDAPALDMDEAPMLGGNAPDETIPADDPASDAASIYAVAGTASVVVKFTTGWTIDLLG